jgi:hypothetical protein
MPDDIDEELAGLPSPNGETDILNWWLAHAEADAEAALAKANEYGSSDLKVVGAALGGEAEAGIAFYILGKAARAVSGVLEGRPVSDDTWHDIVVYGMMARRVRETGRWP